MVTHAKGHVEAFISDFIWPCDEADQGHLLVSALTLAIWLSQQDPDLHLSLYIYPFLIVGINTLPLVPDSLQWVLLGRPL